MCIFCTFLFCSFLRGASSKLHLETNRLAGAQHLVLKRVPVSQFIGLYRDYIRVMLG